MLVGTVIHDLAMKPSCCCCRPLISSGSQLCRESDPSLKSLPVYVRNWGYSLAQCGYYGDPPSVKVFMPQMLEWVLCVIVGRIACGTMVFISAGILGHIARHIDVLFHTLFANNNAKANSAELWAVMVCGPLAMNVVQVRISYHTPTL
eukprot:9470272-Pyramimonas_sp.AAC.1